MKKLLSMTLAMTLCVGMLAGCSMFSAEGKYKSTLQDIMSIEQGTVEGEMGLSIYIGEDLGDDMEEIFDALDLGYKKGVLDVEIGFETQTNEDISYFLIEMLGVDVEMYTDLSDDPEVYFNIKSLVDGLVDVFGMSAPAEEVAAHFGFTVDNIYSKAKAVIK